MLMLAVALVALLMAAVTAAVVPHCTVMVFVTPVTPLKFVPLIVTGTVSTDAFVPHVGMCTLATAGVPLAAGAVVSIAASVSSTSALHDSTATSSAASESAVSTPFILFSILKLLQNNILDIKKAGACSGHASASV
jgi:hypothetical protein